AEEISERARELGCTMVAFDDDLSAAQGRNLEKVVGLRVIDRTQMILDIFAQHAQTKEGRLQIELAQLEYLLPRLRRMWTHLERQKGGIGLRGPGEKQLEMDRRRIQQRLAHLKRDLQQVRRHRAELRRGRRRHGWALVSLIGYTNAGKSTLLNALTGSRVKAYDQLFATLDPTTRQLKLPNHQSALVTDTVGFIRKLPHHLVDSFKATLEEVGEADLLLHVIDAAHPHVERQIAAVKNVLHALGADEKPVLCVLNKLDQESARTHWKRLAVSLGDAVPVSALKGENLDGLRHAVADCLRGRQIPARLRVPLKEAKLISAIRSAGYIRQEEYEGETAYLDVTVPPDLYGHCEKYLLPEDQGDEVGDTADES
ncbi:MAG: GTPase HflX, partial [Verrucomicrobia bacterium]|nr:GTPase HflX [Verrucomicrobiota bacterium]